MAKHLTFLAMHTPAHGFISRYYVTALMRFANSTGEASRDWLASAEVQQLLRHDDQQTRLPLAEWQDALACVAKATGYEDLGLRIAAHAQLGDLGVLGYVLQQCTNIGTALHRLQQYERLINDVNRVQLSVTHESVTLCWGMEHGRPGPLVDEFSIALLIKLTRELVPTIGHPTAVDFINPPPHSVQPYRQFFGCPVRFAQTQTRVVFPVAWLSIHLPTPNPAHLRRALASADQAMANLPLSSPWQQRVAHLIQQQLHEQAPTLRGIAKQLGTSSRSLHRYLVAEGTQLRQVIEQVRNQLAEFYLRDSRLQLTEIAYLLGYGDLTAFSRAFRRQQGVSPQCWRRALAQR